LPNPINIGLLTEGLFQIDRDLKVLATDFYAPEKSPIFGLKFSILATEIALHFFMHFLFSEAALHFASKRAYLCTKSAFFPNDFLIRLAMAQVIICGPASLHHASVNRERAGLKIETPTW